ncbi:hypothetical protein AS850_11340 [Frondihabitans sp. 762G35]|uniref:YrzE family protein n=1 Tax=Frondihabitans sp. 762G35 TaxID=1446794 RepID=UPI000D21DFDE|nr:YrzE family protein [Frondihabitans sp. 762G35]ARC57665.1 hypothetical protein AS850_11340 [Frondihabitans sp. 762G35]
MTDPNTPARGGDHPTATPFDEDDEAVRRDPAEAETVAHETVRDEPVRDEPVRDEPVRDEPVRDETVQHDAAPRDGERYDAPLASEARADDAPTTALPTAEESPARPWSVNRSDRADDAGAAGAAGTTAAAAPAAPPLAQPTAAESPAGGASGLHDDSALRAAEAARAGDHADPAPTTGAGAAPGVATAGAAAAARADDTGDVGDTRITAPTTARSSTAWTPPPAPASPAESPATQATPTPYAPSSGATPTTSTTALSNLGTSPADRLGLGEGIAGGDDGFTPEEMAQRRAFRDEMAFRQKQEFSGINFGAGFFGWLASVGLAGILFAIAGGITLAVGLANTSALLGRASAVTLGSVFTGQTQQITALVVFLVILFLSYFVGGFVAARMSRFSGAKQGLAVWLWGLFMSIIGAVVAVVAASQSVTLADLEGTTGAGFSMSTFTSPSALIAEGLVVVVSIGAALLGGLAGTRFHRRVDRFGLDEV